MSSKQERSGRPGFWVGTGGAGGGCGYYVVGDYNGNESFNVADIVASFSKLKTGEPELIPCELCPPPGWEPSPY